MGKLVVTVCTEDGIFLESEENGTLNRKHISSADLPSLFSAPRVTSVGFVPSMMHYSYKGDVKTIAIATAPEVRQILVRERSERGSPYEKRMVPVPALLWVFRINKERMSSSFLRVMLKNSDSLYRFPFGNTHDNGEICWGNVPLPAITSPRDASRLPEIFFSSGFNGDLYRSPRNNGNASLKEFVLSLATATVFPEAALNSSQENVVSYIEAQSAGGR